MICKSSYVINNDGSITIKPNLLDLIKDNINSNLVHNNHIVYIFIDKNIPGIKFYNLINKTNNTLEFATKRKLVFEAEWDYLHNNPGKTMFLRSSLGNIKIDTYFVSKKEFFRILNFLKKEDDYDKLIFFKLKIKKAGLI